MVEELKNARGRRGRELEKKGPLAKKQIPVEEIELTPEFLRALELLEAARHSAAKAVNALMTATYWEVGRRIVEYEQGGEKRAEYGAALLQKLSVDLTRRFGRGFSERNLDQMRLFYVGWPIPQTVSAESSATLAQRWPLPWSHYVRLLSVENPQARSFYEVEALRGGWSGRQLDRQIATLYYERTALSRDKGFFPS